MKCFLSILLFSVRVFSFPSPFKLNLDRKFEAHETETVILKENPFIFDEIHLEIKLRNGTRPRRLVSENVTLKVSLLNAKPLKIP